MMSHTQRSNGCRLIILALLSIVVLVGCKEEEPAELPIRPVPAMKVGDITSFLESTFPGRAKATEEVNLAFRVAGPLVARPVNVGDAVAQGDEIARIDPRDFETRVATINSRLQQARAQLRAMRVARPEDINRLRASLGAAKAQQAKAKADYQRTRQLYVNDNASKAELDRAKALRDVAREGVNSATEALNIGRRGARDEDVAAMVASIRGLEAQRKALKDALDDTVLRAPFAGFIAQIFVENFQNVRAKQPIVRLLDNSSVEMLIHVPENLISLAPYVTKILCRFDAFPDREITARIKEIGKEASQTTRTYPVTLIMDQPEDIQILPGMAGTVKSWAELPEDFAQAGIEVPLSAILADKDDRKFVWIIDASTQTVSQREVTVGALTDRGIRVTKGLKTGDLIATAGVHYLEAGQRVEPML